MHSAEERRFSTAKFVQQARVPVSLGRHHGMSACRMQVVKAETRQGWPCLGFAAYVGSARIPSNTCIYMPTNHHRRGPVLPATLGSKRVAALLYIGIPIYTVRLQAKGLVFQGSRTERSRVQPAGGVGSVTRLRQEKKTSHHKQNNTKLFPTAHSSTSISMEHVTPSLLREILQPGTSTLPPSYRSEYSTTCFGCCEFSSLFYSWINSRLACAHLACAQKRPTPQAQSSCKD